MAMACSGLIAAAASSAFCSSASAMVAVFQPCIAWSNNDDEMAIMV